MDNSLDSQVFPSRWNYFVKQVKGMRIEYSKLKDSPSILHKSLWAVNMGIFAITSPLWILPGYVAVFLSTDYDSEKRGYVKNNLEMRRSQNHFLERLLDKK